MLNINEPYEPFATCISNVQRLREDWLGGNFPALPKSDLYDWAVERLLKAIEGCLADQNHPALKEHRQNEIDRHKRNFHSCWQAILTPKLNEALELLAEDCIDSLKQEWLGASDYDPDTDE